MQFNHVKWYSDFVWYAFVRVSLRLELRSRKARYAFNSFFLSRARDFTTFTLHDLTDFYIERAIEPHYNISSCLLHYNFKIFIFLFIFLSFPC